MKRLLVIMIATLLLGVMMIPGTAYMAVVDHEGYAFYDLNTITIDFSDFDGSGFQPGGGSGTLDSVVWKTLGMSNGDMNFGDTKTSGDFARGSHAGGASTGGFYAWDVDGDDGDIIAAGWQPTGDDATLGILVMWLRNNTGDFVSGFNVSFDRWVNNDQNRSNSLNFGYQTTEPTDTSHTSTIVDYFTSPGTKALLDDAKGFKKTSSGAILIPQIVPAGGDIYLIWSTDDVGGSGSRDEFGISNISITPYGNDPPPVPELPTILLMSLGLLGLGGYIVIKRRRAGTAAIT